MPRGIHRLNAHDHLERIAAADAAGIAIGRSLRESGGEAALRGPRGMAGLPQSWQADLPKAIAGRPQARRAGGDGDGAGRDACSTEIAEREPRFAEQNAGAVACSGEVADRDACSTESVEPSACPAERAAVDFRAMWGEDGASHRGGEMVRHQKGDRRASMSEPALVSEPGTIPGPEGASGSPMPLARVTRLMGRDPADPDHPVNWRRRELRRLRLQPRVQAIYGRIRRALWDWPEFQDLSISARRTLEVVVELAREEAFPWAVGAQCELVMRLARFQRKTYTRVLQELESLAVTRPARRIALVDPDAERLDDSARLAEPSSTPALQNLGRRVNAVVHAAWPCGANRWGVDCSFPRQKIAQWVVRLRRGTPWHADRAAWWINYDLLCGTERVLPCWEANMQTLALNYRDRRQRMGASPGWESDASFAAMVRWVALRGPAPLPGMRTALWDGMPEAATAR